jgi:hypothetical protein
MAYLTAAELPTYYPKAKNMAADDVTTYLAQANAYASGVIGGKLPADKVDDGLKTAVATAFGVFARGETAQVNSVNGNITPAAPADWYNRPTSRQYDPLDSVKTMLTPYAVLFDSLNKAASENGFMFLGGS